MSHPAIASTTPVQLAHVANHWELFIFVPDGRHSGVVKYTLHINHDDKNTLQIATEDGEDYEVIPDEEWKEVHEHYPMEARYITNDMATAYGFMPHAATAYLTLRWDAINLLVIPTRY